MNLSVNIAGVTLKNPVTVASGTFGSGMEYGEFVDLNRLGAVTTKGVANVPWPGNATPRIAETCGGIDILDSVRESAALLMRAGIPYEFRTTAVHPLHSPEEMREIGAWLRGAQRFFVQQFTDSGDLVGSGLTALSAKEMADLRDAICDFIPTAAIRGI